MPPTTFAIGPFELDAAAFRLTHGGDPVAVQPKALELLMALARADGAVVPNEALREALWPDVVVTDQSLRQVLLKLREALGAHGSLVETVPRKGLRLARSVEAPRVPAERDAFVGRVAELDAVRARIRAGARLLTVIGPGGVGKTRLAVRFSRDLVGGPHPRDPAGDWPGGACFADLSAAWTVDDVAHAVAVALGLAPAPGDAVTRIGTAIAARGRCLVVLDNFEQVARHAEDTVVRWLESASEVQFLVTSRDVLGLPGEDVLVLDPLTEADAIALFRLRAAVGPDDVHVGLLTELLDRLPLAIELAAARVRVMPTAEIVRRIGQRFDLVAAPHRRDRHATLRTAIEWSWDLLAEPERAGLLQLSVFEGGFTLDAAEAVLDVPGAWAVDVVQALVDRSWLRRVGDRFEWLRSLQAFAGHHLDDGGGRLRAEIRHGAWFAGRTMPGAADLHNLVVACRRAVERGDAHTAAHALVGAWEALQLRGPYSLGIELALAVRALPGAGPTLVARAAWVHGDASRVCGLTDAAAEHFDTALVAAREAGDRRFEGVVLRGYGVLRAEQGRVDEAGELLEAALGLWQETGDRKQQALVLHNFAAMDSGRGRLARAKDRMDVALAIYREVGDRRLEALALGATGSISGALGHPAEAMAAWEQALEAHRAVGDRRGEAIVLRDLGNAHLDGQRLDDAGDCYAAALALHRSLGDRRGEAVVLGNLGRLHDQAGDASEARTWFTAALAVAREVSDPGFSGLLLGRLGLLDARDGRHAEAAEQLDAGEALLRGASQSLGLAELLVDRAEAAHLAGRPAGPALDEAAALARAAGEGSPLARRVEEAARRLR